MMLSSFSRAYWSFRYLLWWHGVQAFWVLSSYWVAVILCIVWIQVLYQFMICKYFLPVCELSFSFLFFFKDFIYVFLEKGREGKRKGEKHWCARDTLIKRLPLTHPLLGTWRATQACAMTGNQTREPLVHRPSLNHWATPARSGFLLS